MKKMVAAFAVLAARAFRRPASRSSHWRMSQRACKPPVFVAADLRQRWRSTYMQLACVSSRSLNASTHSLAASLMERPMLAKIALTRAVLAFGHPMLVLIDERTVGGLDVDPERSSRGGITAWRWE
jgi:hypothetical protein